MNRWKIVFGGAVLTYVAVVSYCIGRDNGMKKELNKYVPIVEEQNDLILRLINERNFLTVMYEVSKNEFD